jgi:hypothetical protein
MLDWGLDHLERDLQSAWGQGATRDLAKTDYTPVISVDYDAAGDNIVVYVSFTAYDRTDTGQICRQIVTFLRDGLDPREPNGKRREDAQKWLIYFFHAGAGKPESTPKWKRLELSIPPLVVLKVSVYSKTGTNCSARLIEDDITFDK